MCQEKSRRKLSRWMWAIMIPTIAGVLLSGCDLLEAAPERSFTTRDLLIGLSDMPPGWTVSDPPKRLKDDVSSKDASITIFQADTDVIRRGASHRAYRYRSRSGAGRMYEEYIRRKYGTTPPEWTYQSPVADQSYFSCYDNEGREPLNCEWSGRYEEYVVVFGSWIIPGRMSLQDMERVVRAIDARMAQYLGKPYPEAPTQP